MPKRSVTPVPALTLLLLACATPAQAQRPLGDFQGQTNVGTARHGHASYDPVREVYDVAGSGANMWADHDDFHFVWKRLSGDFILTARGHLLGKGVEAHRKLGWTVRSTLEAGSPHVTAALHGDGLAALQFRRAAGATTEEVRSPATGADVVQLERRGGRWIMSVARFGDTLTAVETRDVPLGDSVYAGIFVCAHNDSVTERATFDDVRITRPAAEGFVPYRDYIGGNLEILDVATGARSVVFRSPEPIQAPNWTRDGRALVYNNGGRLFRFDLASRRVTPLKTGADTANNNDHVLSFDGRTLGISNQSPDDGGKSIVYTVPLAGGTPKRITALGPSYLHGWSPDGRFLVYTAERGGDFDVYRIPSGGGAETRLTSEKGLDDGPEYAPDGRTIFFNSVRSGTMQLWRMAADGADARQLTSDGYNNWFPHVSPDGKRIVFISFGPDVAPADHPWYRHVYIRLLPVEGGEARVIAYVYGGQGTINVPSWSPDSRRIAFVSNTRMD